MPDPVVPPLLRQIDLDSVETFSPNTALLAVHPDSDESVNLTMRGVSRAHLQVLHNIATLVGLTNSLASYPTLQELSGKLVGFIFQEDFYFYRLAFSDIAEDAPNVVYPNDRGVAPNNRLWRFQGTLGHPTADTPLVVAELPPPHLDGRQWLATLSGRIFTSFGGEWVEFAGAGSSSTEVTLPQILALVGNGTTISPAYLPPLIPEGLNYQLLVLLDDGATSTFVPGVIPGSVVRAGPDYTVAAVDAARYVIRNHSSTLSLSIAAAATGVYAYSPDQATIVFNDTTFNLTIVGLTGVTLKFPAGRNVLAPFESAVVRRVGATNTWHIN